MNKLVKIFAITIIVVSIVAVIYFGIAFMPRVVQLMDALIDWLGRGSV